MFFTSCPVNQFEAKTIYQKSSHLNLIEQSEDIRNKRMFFWFPVQDRARFLKKTSLEQAIVLLWQVDILLSNGYNFTKTLLFH